MVRAEGPLIRLEERSVGGIGLGFAHSNSGVFNKHLRRHLYLGGRDYMCLFMWKGSPFDGVFSNIGLPTKKWKRFSGKGEPSQHWPLPFGLLLKPVHKDS